MSFLSSPTAAAIILLAAGLPICFLGYRVFRWLLAVYGFVCGAYLTSLLVTTSSSWISTLALVGGGLVGLVVLQLVYLAGLAIIGASLGVLALNLVWWSSGTPASWQTIVACLIGAVAAVTLQRYVIIVGTAFGGAWTTLVGAFALGGHARAVAVASGDPWLIYPMSPAQGQLLFAISWFCLGVVASFLQLRAASPAHQQSTDG
jgi:hypothetical protein